MRALIVEDEIFSANNLKNIVSRYGVDVIEIVDNAEEALTLCRRHKPELVLMDIMLQGPLSGVEAAVEIRHTISENIFIVFLSAYSDREMIEYAVDANAFAYLLKPYREGEIIATIELIRSRSEQTKRSYSYPVNRRISLASGYVFDIKRQKLYHRHHEIAISKNSKKLLDILCRNRQIFVSAEEIIRHIWEEADGGSLTSLRSLIYRLKNTTDTSLIKNHNRIGYKIILKDNTPV